MAKINSELPVVQRIKDIVSIILSNKVTILGAETGAGKTTIVPFALWKMGVGKVVVTGPRRLGVHMCAEYVKELADLEEDDSRIAFQHKIENCRTRDTELAYVTEGILLQELREDATLSKYQVIIVDEVHERSTNVDMLLAFLRLAVRDREDLHVVIMSATLDIDSYAKYFNTDATITIPGRQFPVSVSYEHTSIRYDNDLYKAIAERVYATAQGEEEGDILVFLPDEVSIQKVRTHLKRLGYTGFQVFTLISSQSKDERNAALGSCIVRKVILATNVAETSVTLEGVVFVIDSCRIKQDYYIDAYMGGLSVTMHSRAGLDQRKGRAGRVRSGYCHRMITEGEHAKLPAYTEPQIMRVPKADVLLSLFERGFTYADVLRMEWITSPEVAQWEEARQLLRDFKYVTPEDVLTQRGKKILDLHIAPLFGLFIIAGETCECLLEMLLFVAALQQQNSPFFNLRNREGGDVVNENRRDFIVSNSDFLSFYQCFSMYLACQDRHERLDFSKRYGINLKAMDEIHRDWEDLCERMKGAGVTMSSARQHEDPLDQLSFALLAALKHHLIVDSGRSYFTADRQSGDIKSINIFPGSFVSPRDRNTVLVYAYERATSRLFAHWCHIISLDLLEETAVNYLRTQVVAERGRIVVERYLHEVLLRVHTHTALTDETPEEVRNQVYLVYQKSAYGSSGSSVASRVNYILIQLKQHDELRLQFLARIASVFPHGEFDVICREVSEDALHRVVDAYCDELRMSIREDTRFIEFERLVVAAREFNTSYGHFVSTASMKELCELDVVTLSEAESITGQLAHELATARNKLPSYDEIEKYRSETYVRNQEGLARLYTLITPCPFCNTSLDFSEKMHAYVCGNVDKHHALMVGMLPIAFDICCVDFYYTDLESLCTSGVLQSDRVYRVSLPRQFLATEIEERCVRPIVCNTMTRIHEVAKLFVAYRDSITTFREFERYRAAGYQLLSFGHDARGIYAIQDPSIRMMPLTKPEGFEMGREYLCEVYQNASYRNGLLVRSCLTVPDFSRHNKIVERITVEYPEFVHLLEV